jgi:hypothetical protein
MERGLSTGLEIAAPSPDFLALQLPHVLISKSGRVNSQMHITYRLHTLTEGQQVIGEMVILTLTLNLLVLLYVTPEHILRVFENRVLRRIFGAKREEVVRGWKRLHNEELHNLYVSSNVTRVIKSRRMRLVGNVPCMGKIRNAYSILVGNPEGRNHSEDVGIHGRIILEWTLVK